MVSRLRRAANTEVSVRQIEGVGHRDYFKVEASQLWDILRDWLKVDIQAQSKQANPESCVTRSRHTTLVGAPGRAHLLIGEQ
jgi:hypothetical protein